ncbi:hypothetical protein FC92_GL001082 [Liquorilactobacillus hordei DSM 19519]|uniref:Uncharacterized protein n=1 Tax=Liquorilactobacillus hordei DSM 19519 TaxID=1423759 RepID=A0A0R1MSS3_9LACO|nr:hypothetical protein FC92_GL001082 [Liquorilactobacillus hordei DSM 19519]
MDDRVVIKLDNTAKNRLNKGRDNITIINEQVLGKLENFQPAEEKIKMTVEEAKEFEELKSRISSARIYMVLFSIINNCTQFPALYKFQANDINQFNLAKAWVNPSLIEVSEPEKYEIKIGRQYLQLNKSNVFLLASELGIVSLRTELTLDEVKEAEKQLGIQGLQAKWHEAAKEETK